MGRFDSLIFKMKKADTENLRTWIELDKAALRHNLQIFRRLIGPNRQLMAVVKSNAYGHGLIDFSRAAAALGVDWFGVDSIVEAESLRRAKIKQPILVLGYTLPAKIETATKEDVVLTIGDLISLKSAASKTKLGHKLKIHLKIDTGMHRQGFSFPELAIAIKLIKKHPAISLEGVYTHFASAKNPAFPAATNRQLSEFKQAIAQLEAAGFKNLTKHAAATSGTIIFPDSHFDLARIGIGLYGLWPSRETEAACRDKIKLKPVLSWKTIVSQIKTLPAGSQLGYDFTATLTQSSQIALMPVGYWHGLPRALSGLGQVLIKGRKAKILGRISMDMVSVDVTGIKNLKVGDEAVLIGPGLPVEILADLSGTINYELVTRINPLIKKFVV